ncbi:MAG: hypothetical protein II767_06230, partial [Proteobacteria bacterium]|nr:hypothetical protein [Pseudomonadota bacterium]
MPFAFSDLWKDAGQLSGIVLLCKWRFFAHISLWMRRIMTKHALFSSVILVSLLMVGGCSD